MEGDMKKGREKDREVQWTKTGRVGEREGGREGDRDEGRVGNGERDMQEEWSWGGRENKSLFLVQCTIILK